MRYVARLSDNDRRELFRNTADKMGLNDAIVEKDFWVCFILDYLFHRSPWKEAITFKGGTSLSKAFHLISRFSEDIDLILDWRVLGYGINEPWEERSNTRQDAFNKEANARAEVFLAETFCPTIKAELSQELGCEANIYIDDKDKQTVIFAYPNLFTNAATLQVIRLEIGALAAWTPRTIAEIRSYAAEQYPAVFGQDSTKILTAAPERTFWEKATILHHEANRPEHLPMPQRYSRHYYDLYRMAITPIKNAAFARLDLLNKVVDFKMKFYPRAWAKYPEAIPGTLKLVPPEYRLAALEEDYDVMRDMLYGNVPSFAAVMDAVRTLEQQINALQLPKLNNPWKEIDLIAYENHMGLSSVFQLQALNRMMKEQFNSYPVQSIMVLGVAGGNGLEHIDKRTIKKVYGVDINQDYLEVCVSRYPELQGVLDTIHADLTQESNELPYADLIVADLIIEYIGYECFQKAIDQISPQYVSAIIQINVGTDFVSDSPYLHTFDRLDEIHHQVEETALVNAMEKIGYKKVMQIDEDLPNGKKLVRLDFTH